MVKNKSAMLIFAAIVLVCCICSSLFLGCKTETKKQLDIYTWEGYLPEEVVTEFEEETGIKLNITVATDNNMMVTLLKSGGKADIIMPTHSHLIRYYEDNLCHPINFEKISNYELIVDSFMDQPSIKWNGKNIGGGEIYAVPYIFGTSGIVVNTAKYSKNLENIGWEILFDTGLKGKVSAKNGMDSTGILLDVLGIPRDALLTDTAATLEKIKEKSKDLKNNVLKFYDSGAEISDLLKNDEVWVSYIWDGGGRTLMQYDSKFKYFLPKEGGSGWIDSFMIPKTASNTDGAYLFINFMLKPEIASIVTMKSGYTTSVEGSLDMAKDIDKNLYQYTDEQLAKIKWLVNYTEEVRSAYNVFWEEILAE